eukprot:scaffold18791_cov106-Isochrysis_galbana.AAC.8
MARGAGGAQQPSELGLGPGGGGGDCLQIRYGVVRGFDNAGRRGRGEDNQNAEKVEHTGSYNLGQPPRGFLCPLGRLASCRCSGWFGDAMPAWLIARPGGTWRPAARRAVFGRIRL